MHKKKILFVDDEEKILKSLNRLFIDDNEAEVLLANSGMEGLTVLDKNKDVAVIISDQRMPEMNGAEFLEKSLQFTPNAVRLVLTGYADVKSAMDAINKGKAHQYLTKPWDDDLLVRTINGAAEKYNLEKENKRLTTLTKEQNEELKKWNAELEERVKERTKTIDEKNKELQQKNEKLRTSFSNSLTAFSRLIDLRDKNLRGHSNRVAKIAGLLGEKLGLPESELENITWASFLHVIGLLGMPTELSHRDIEEYDPGDQKTYKMYPSSSQRAIEAVRDLVEAGRIIRHHQEWFNGKGFPDGLKGSKIPIGSRILGVVDYLDLTVTRLGTNTGINHALKEIESKIKKRFDPDLFPHLKEIAGKFYSVNKIE